MRWARKDNARAVRRRRGAFFEPLETRLLLTVYTITDSGNAATNESNLQGDINAANAGDTIIINAGIVCQGVLTLPSKAFAYGSGTITIESSMLSSLPTGVRVSPADAAFMPTIEVSNTGNYAIVAAADSHDYQLLGLNITAGPINAFNNLVALGANSLLHAVDAPTNILLDRCYVHGVPGMDQKNGIALNGYNITVSNCYISEIHSTFQDATGISGSDGPGNYYILNNYVEASTENILFGGADPADVDPGFEPNTNIVVQGNLFSKPLSWSPYDPSYVVPNAGTNYWVKNLFELKNASNVTIDDNIFQNNWAGADQWGFAIVFTPRNQSNGDPTARVQYVTFSNNIVRNSGAGLTIMGEDTPHVSLPAHDITVQNNLFYNIGGPQFGAKGGTGFQLTEGGAPSYNITIDHNTMFETDIFLSVGTNVSGTNASNGPIITNNLAYHALYGVQGGGKAEGNNSLSNAFPNGYTFTGNVIIGANPANYPSGNFYPATGDAVGIADFSGEEFSLLPTSPYKGVDPGSTNPGVNYSTLDPEFVPIDANLLGYWKFDEGTGTTTADASGNGHTGTLSGSPLPTWTTSGQTLDGLSFNGSAGYVSVPTFAAPTNLTMSAWIKPSNDTGSESTILSKGSAEFSMQIDSVGYLAVTIAGITLTDGTFNYYAAANTGKWYLVGATFDSTTDTVTIYRNGVATTVGVNGGTIADSGLPLWIGRDEQTNSGTFLGVLDEVRYSGQAYSASQMAGLYANYAPQADYIFLPNDPTFTGDPNGYPTYGDPLTGTTGGLSTYAVSHVVSTSLTFTWSVASQPAGVAPPTFSPSGTYAARNTTVTFHGAGVYIFAVTVADPSGASATYDTTPHIIPLPSGDSFTEYIPVTVAQTLTSVSIVPSIATVNDSATRQFTAIGYDQFGIPMVTQPTFTWSVSSGVGSINPSTGLYTAPASGTGSATVKATSGSFTPTTTSITITSTLAPTVVSINRAGSSSTNASSAAFTVTFSSSVTGVNTTDFSTVNGAGVSGTSVASVSGSGATWTVNVNTGSGSGTLGLNLNDNDSIKDSSTNIPLGGTGTTNGSGNGSYVNSQTYLLDRVPPVISITAPTITSLYNTGTPTITGIAGAAIGDSTTVTVKIYAGGTATGTAAQTLTTTANATTGAYSVTPSSALGQGQFTVQASQSDSAGNNGTSSAITFNVDTVAPVISIGSPTGGSATNNVTPTISGTAGITSGDLTMVLVKVYAGGSATGTPLQTLLTTANPSTGAFSVPVTSALGDGQYTLQATQSDSADNTGYSAAVTFTIAEVTASDGTYPDKVQVTWTAVDGATGYDVWRSTSDDSGTAVQLNSTDISGTTFDDTTAAPGTVYWYWVTAKNAAGSGAFSDPDSGYEAPAVSGSFTFDTAGNADSYYLKVDPTGAYLQISFSTVALAVPTYQIALTQLTSLNLNLLGTSNTVYVDFSGGSPVPTDNITITCNAAAQDELEVIGNNPSQVFTMTDTQIGLANGPGIAFQNLATLAVSNLVVYYSGTLSTIQNLDIEAGTTFAWGRAPPQNDDGSQASNQAPVNVNDAPATATAPASPPAATSTPVNLVMSPPVAAPAPPSITVNNAFNLTINVAASPSTAEATPASHHRDGTSSGALVALPTTYKHPKPLPPLTRGTSWHGDRTAHVVQKIDIENGEQQIIGQG